MRQIRHPLSGYLYEQDGDGHVLVTSRDGRTGRFRPDGSWVSGDVRSADPQLCGWIGGPELASRHAAASKAAKEAEGALP
jgi:hypothetical protein